MCCCSANPGPSWFPTTLLGPRYQRPKNPEWCQLCVWSCGNPRFIRLSICEFIIFCKFTHLESLIFKSLISHVLDQIVWKLIISCCWSRLITVTQIIITLLKARAIVPVYVMSADMILYPHELASLTHGLVNLALLCNFNLSSTSSFNHSDLAI